MHCYIPEALRQPGDPAARRAPLGMSTAEVKHLLDELAACETLFLVFTGGEIFLRPDLEELTAYATQRGFAVRYYTNGFHVTPRWGQTMKQLGIYGVDVSVYGASEETYYAVTKARGGYRRVVETLGHLRDNGVRFTVKTPVLRENYRDLPAIKALAEEYGGFFRYDLVLIPRFDGDEAPYAHRLANEEVEALLTEMRAKYPAQPAAAFEPHACAVGKWSAVISPEGEVYPCIEMRHSLGNVRQQPFSEIWNSNPHMRRIRETLANMKPNAEFADGLCGHCPAHSLKTAGDMTQPSAEHLRLAAVKRKFIQA